MFKHLAIATAAGVALMAGSAQALPVFNDGSLAIFAATDTTTDLTTTTVYHLSAPFVGEFFLGSGAHDFTGISGTVSVGTNVDLTDATTFDFSDTGIGTFTAATGPVQFLSSPPGVLSFIITGTYLVGNDFANAGTVLTGDETFSFTQTAGPGNSISISGTFQSPATNVPEPVTLSLFGAGLAALGFARRSKKQ